MATSDALDARDDIRYNEVVNLKQAQTGDLMERALSEGLERIIDKAAQL